MRSLLFVGLLLGSGIQAGCSRAAEEVVLAVAEVTIRSILGLVVGLTDSVSVHQAQPSVDVSLPVTEEEQQRRAEFVAAQLQVAGQRSAGFGDGYRERMVMVLAGRMVPAVWIDRRSQTEYAREWHAGFALAEDDLLTIGQPE